MTPRTVPVLVTGDVDFSKHHAPTEKTRSFNDLCDLGRDLDIPFTLYFVGREAEQVPDHVTRMHAAGHEIGCHGLTHGDEEEYNRMPEPMQREYINEATAILKRLTGQDVVSFRSPRVKISETTLRVLSSLGYESDSSVCSQRCDIVSSNGLNLGWLRAPRLPYRPSENDPFRRGEMTILEIPISAAIVPFISSSLYVAGVTAMRLLFRLLYSESLRTGKPIVYLFHPYEFSEEIPGAKSYDRNRRVHGFRFRRKLYRGNPREKLNAMRRLFEYARAFERVEFMTVRDFVRSRGIDRLARTA